MFSKKLTATKSLITIIAALVLIAVVSGLTLAFLTNEDSDIDTGIVGSVKIAVYTGSGASTLVSGTYNESTNTYTPGTPVTVTLGAQNVAVPVNLFIKNNGTINGLVKVNVILTLKAQSELENDVILTTEQVNISNSGWVNQFLDSENEVYFFNSYYNSPVASQYSQPGQLKSPAISPTSVLTSITPIVSGLSGRTVEIQVVAEIIAHSGNPYYLESLGQTIDPSDKPWDLSSAFLTTWTAWQVNP